MRCDRAQSAMSERFDGEHLPDALARDVEAHVRSCASCRSFETRAERLRAAMRIHAVEPVPDLVDPIMQQVAEEPRAHHDELAARREAEDERIRPGRVAARTRPRTRIAPIVAAVLVGALIGSVLVGGPFPGDGGGGLDEATAIDVPSEVLARAAGLESFRASYRVTQVDQAASPASRTFGLRTWLIAPEQFRLEVQEKTDPARLDRAGVPPNDLTYVGTPEVSLTSTFDCTTGYPNCEDVTTVVTDRPPFSTASSLPTDLVLPVNALGGADDVRVLERGTVEGRDAVLVEVPFERAEPLFAFREATGTFRWRRFYPTDRVRVWLDRTEWFPIQIDVFPSRSEARRTWALRNNVAQDRPDQSILSLTLRSASTEVNPDRFRVEPRGPSSTEGARRVDTDTLDELLAFGVDDVAAAAGLEPYRAARAPAGPTGEDQQLVVAYSRGLSWLTVAQTSDWEGPGLFGEVDELGAELIELPGGGVGYFEPGSESTGRRLAVHTDGGDFVLETNLPRERLFEAASALGVTGRTIPPAWAQQQRVSTARALDRVGGSPDTLPLASLPDGYRITGAAIAGRTATLFYRPEDALDGPPIDVTIAPGSALPPGSLEAQEVDTLPGRYTPSLGTLEWVDDGLRYSISAPDEPLQRLVGLALAFEPGTAG